MSTSMEPLTKKQKLIAETSQEIKDEKERDDAAFFTTRGSSPSPDLDVVKHPEFTCLDEISDIRILSSDGISFDVHEANLISVFASLIDKRYNDLPLKLEEDSKVLEDILPFCYSSSYQSRTWQQYLGNTDSINAIEKFKIFRGAEVYGAAILEGLVSSKDHYSISLGILIEAFGVASAFQTSQLMLRIAHYLRGFNPDAIHAALEINRNSTSKELKINADDAAALLGYILRNEAFWLQLCIKYYYKIVSKNHSCKLNCDKIFPATIFFGIKSVEELSKVRDHSSPRCRACLTTWNEFVQQMLVEAKEEPLYEA